MWFSVDCDVGINRKFIALSKRIALAYNERSANVQRTVRECENDAIGSVMKIFAEVMRSYPTGDVSQLTDDVFERWAVWLGPEGALGAAFRDIFVSDGMIKGWAERNGQLVAKREAAADRMREKRSGNVQRTFSEREANVPAASSERAPPTVTVTVTDTEELKASSHLRARDELADTLTPAGRVRFIATCDGYLQGLGLPAGLSATDDDVELAAADWLANNSDAKPSALAFRAYVEKIIRRRLAAERSAPAAPVPGFTRTNGKVSSGEQGFINARLSSLIDPYDLSHQQEKS